MSSESLDSANQILNAFVNRKVTLDNTSALNAQRLVNQFRQISAFKPEFVAEYNKLLLAASDEELMMMKDIVGGPTVRQYLEFLRKTLNESVDENTNGEQQANSVITGNDGYLPSPDDELPIFAPIVRQSISNEGNTTESSLGQMDLIAQTMKTMQESNQHQTTILNETLNTLKEQINKNVSGLKETTNTSNISIQDFERWKISQEQFLQKIIKAQNDTFIQFAKTLSEQLAAQMTSVIAKPTDTIQSERKHYQIETESLIQNTDSNNTEKTTDIFEETPIDIDINGSDPESDIITESTEPTEYNSEGSLTDDNMSIVTNPELDVITESTEPTEYNSEDTLTDDNMNVITTPESDVITESTEPTEYNSEDTLTDDNMNVITTPESDVITESTEPTEYNSEDTLIDDNMSIVTNPELDVITESIEPMEYNVEEATTNIDSNISETTTEPIVKEQTDVQFSPDIPNTETQNINFTPPIPNSIPTFKPTQNKGIPLPPPPFGTLPKIPKMFGSIPPMPKGFPQKIASHITDTNDSETDVPATPLNKIDL